MAVTLPYEDMEFVPLDILTAQEQNQLVANIEYLAGVFPVQNADISNGAISTSKIEPGAVTTSRIDWGSLSDHLQVGVRSGVTFQGAEHTSGGFVEVSFPTAFPTGTVPKIFTTCDVDSGYLGAVMVTAVTNTGFTCLCRTNRTVDQANKSFSWLAIAL